MLVGGGWHGIRRVLLLLVLGPSYKNGEGSKLKGSPPRLRWLRCARATWIAFGRRAVPPRAATTSGRGRQPL
jgi:hypothetical protein